MERKLVVFLTTICFAGALPYTKMGGSGGFDFDDLNGGSYGSSLSGSTYGSKSHSSSSSRYVKSSGISTSGVGSSRGGDVFDSIDGDVLNANTGMHTGNNGAGYSFTKNVHVSSSDHGISTGGSGLNRDDGGLSGTFVQRYSSGGGNSGYGSGLNVLGGSANQGNYGSRYESSYGYGNSNPNVNGPMGQSSFTSSMHVTGSEPMTKTTKLHTYSSGGGSFGGGSPVFGSSLDRMLSQFSSRNQNNDGFGGGSSYRNGNNNFNSNGGAVSKSSFTSSTYSSGGSGGESLSAGGSQIPFDTTGHSFSETGSAQRLGPWKSGTREVVGSTSFGDELSGSFVTSGQRHSDLGGSIAGYGDTNNDYSITKNQLKSGSDGLGNSSVTIYGANKKGDQFRLTNETSVIVGDNGHTISTSSSHFVSERRSQVGHGNGHTNVGGTLSLTGSALHDLTVLQDSSRTPLHYVGVSQSNAQSSHAEKSGTQQLPEKGSSRFLSQTRQSSNLGGEFGVDTLGVTNNFGTSGREYSDNSYSQTSEARRGDQMGTGDHISSATRNEEAFSSGIGSNANPGNRRFGNDRIGIPAESGLGGGLSGATGYRSTITTQKRTLTKVSSSSNSGGRGYGESGDGNGMLKLQESGNKFQSSVQSSSSPIGQNPLAVNGVPSSSSSRGHLNGAINKPVSSGGYVNAGSDSSVPDRGTLYVTKQPLPSSGKGHIDVDNESDFDIRQQSHTVVGNLDGSAPVFQQLDTPIVVPDKNTHVSTETLTDVSSEVSSNPPFIVNNDDIQSINGDFDSRRDSISSVLHGKTPVTSTYNLSPNSNSGTRHYNSRTIVETSGNLPSSSYHSTNRNEGRDNRNSAFFGILDSNVPKINTYETPLQQSSTRYYSSSKTQTSSYTNGNDRSTPLVKSHNSFDNNGKENHHVRTDNLDGKLGVQTQTQIKSVIGALDGSAPMIINPPVVHQTAVMNPNFDENHHVRTDNVDGKLGVQTQTQTQIKRVIGALDGSAPMIINPPAVYESAEMNPNSDENHQVRTDNVKEEFVVQTQTKIKSVIGALDGSAPMVIKPPAVYESAEINTDSNENPHVNTDNVKEEFVVQKKNVIGALDGTSHVSNKPPSAYKPATLSFDSDSVKKSYGPTDSRTDINDNRNSHSVVKPYASTNNNNGYSQTKSDEFVSSVGDTVPVSTFSAPSGGNYGTRYHSSSTTVTKVKSSGSPSRVTSHNLGDNVRSYSSSTGENPRPAHRGLSGIFGSLGSGYQTGSVLSNTQRSSYSDNYDVDSDRNRAHSVNGNNNKPTVSTSHVHRNGMNRGYSPDNLELSGGKVNGVSVSRYTTNYGSGVGSYSLTERNTQTGIRSDKLTGGSDQPDCDTDVSNPIGANNQFHVGVLDLGDSMPQSVRNPSPSFSTSHGVQGGANTELSSDTSSTITKYVSPHNVGSYGTRISGTYAQGSRSLTSPIDYSPSSVGGGRVFPSSHGFPGETETHTGDLNRNGFTSNGGHSHSISSGNGMSNSGTTYHPGTSGTRTNTQSWTRKSSSTYGGGNPALSSVGGSAGFTSFLDYERPLTSSGTHSMTSGSISGYGVSTSGGLSGTYSGARTGESSTFNAPYRSQTNSFLNSGTVSSNVHPDMREMTSHSNTGSGGVTSYSSSSSAKSSSRRNFRTSSDNVMTCPYADGRCN